MEIAEIMSALADYNTHPGVQDRDRSALLVIDMQHFFSDIAVPVLGNVVALVRAARAAGRPVVFTRHGHRDLAVDGGVLAGWWDEDLAMVGTPPWQLLADLAPRAEDMVIDKTRYSAFHGTELESYLQDHGITDLVICGVMTNCCCETTARDGFMRDFNVCVAADATATLNDDLHLSSLKGMAYACARIRPTSDLVSAWA